MQSTVNTSGEQDPDPDHRELARKIQRVMIPGLLPSLEGIDIRALFLPSGNEGGDLYDVIKMADDTIAFLMFNVEGTGLEPVLVTAMAKICFVNHINQRVFPFAVIERVNSDLFRMVGEDLRLTAFIGYLDPHDLKLTYCNTTAVSPVLFRRDSTTSELLTGNTASIGSSAEIVHEEQYVYLQQGDALVLFSDGVYGIRWSDGSGNELSFEEKIRTSLIDTTASELLEDIACRHRDAGRTAQVADDVSVISVEVLTQSRKNQIKDRLGFKNGDKVYLQFLNYLEEMDRTTSTILAALDIAGFKDEDIRKMKIILTELLVNAIVHGNHKDYSRKVVVGHLIDPDQAVVSILDEGSGFDPSVIPDPTLPENLEKPCGRGLFIVKHYVESIAFNETGNRVTITKKNLHQ